MIFHSCSSVYEMQNERYSFHLVSQKLFQFDISHPVKISIHLFSFYNSVKAFDTLWPSDTVWWHGSGSAWVQVMACCLMAPSHYLNLYGPLIIRAISAEVLMNFICNMCLEITFFKLLPHLPGTNELKYSTYITETFTIKHINQCTFFSLCH